MWFVLTDCDNSEEANISAKSTCVKKSTCEGSYRFIDKPIDIFVVYQHSERLDMMSLYIFFTLDIFSDIKRCAFGFFTCPIWN